MSATIRVANAEATLENQRWTAERPGLARLLNTLMPEIHAEVGDPDPERTVAERAVARLGHGEILHVDPYELPAGIV